jgi:Flp pilus assembly protein TadB
MDFKLRARYNLDERLWTAETVVASTNILVLTFMPKTHVRESEERAFRRFTRYKTAHRKATIVHDRIQGRIKSIKYHIKRSRIRNKMDPRRCRRTRFWRLRRYNLWRLLL